MFNQQTKQAVEGQRLLKPLGLFEGNIMRCVEAIKDLMLFILAVMIFYGCADLATGQQSGSSIREYHNKTGGSASLSLLVKP